jgi:hypothetical protein
MADLHGLNFVSIFSIKAVGAIDSNVSVALSITQDMLAAAR